jgi:hypothetical protein
VFREPGEAECRNRSRRPGGVVERDRSTRRLGLRGHGGGGRARRTPWSCRRRRLHDCATAAGGDEPHGRVRRLHPHAYTASTETRPVTVLRGLVPVCLELFPLQSSGPHHFACLERALRRHECRTPPRAEDFPPCVFRAFRFLFLSP